MQLNIDPKTQREAWLKGRREGLGSSDAPAIVLPANSRPKYMSPWKVWDSKINGVEEEIESLFMEWGNLFEPTVGEYVATQRNKQLNGEDDCWLTDGGWYRSDDHPWMMASPDFWLRFGNREREGVECKVIQNMHNAADWLEGSAPPHVTVQAHWCMAVIGAKRWHICALMWYTQEFRMYTVEYDQAFQDKMISKAHAWWTRHIIDGETPPVDHTDACKDAIYRRSPDHDAIIRDANDIEAQLIREYAHARECATAADQNKKRVENLLKEITSGNRGIASPYGRFLWSTRKGKTSLDQKRIKAEHPDLFNEYTKQGASYRAITFSTPKVK